MRFFPTLKLAILTLLFAIAVIGQEPCPSPSPTVQSPTLTQTEPYYGGLLPNWIGRRNRRTVEVVNQPANLTDLSLDKATIYTSCPVSSSVSCIGADARIKVETIAEDNEKDVLVYKYTVSAGEIVGDGTSVIWDLTNARPGTHTITAGVDDGCGICGKTMTKTVEVIDPQGDAEMILDKTEICLVCPYFGSKYEIEKKKEEQMMVDVRNIANKPSSGSSFYYSVSGGKIVGEGPNIKWDLREALPGTYTITAGFGKRNILSGEAVTRTVTVGECSGCCMKPCECPIVSINGPARAKRGQTVVISAIVEGMEVSPKFAWTVVGGIIIGAGDGKTILVKIPADIDQPDILASFEIEGTDPACNCVKGDSVTIKLNK